MTLETKYGVPTVAVHTDKFDRVVRSVAQVNGMPGLRQVFVPQPIMGKTPAELRAYVDGTDPITGRPVMQEVLEGLTRPFEADELGPTEFDRSTPRLVEADSEDTLQRRFVENRWTDMLPIVLPTEARVAEMLRHTKRQPDEIVGRMRSTHFREHWAYSVEKVAVNAVMAGARPEYFPVILALAATGDSAVSGFSGVRSTAFTLGLREKYWREHVRNLLRGIDPNGPPTLLLDPIAARQFVDRGGFTKKDALLDWLHDNALMPAGEYWDYQLVQNYIYPRATFGEEPWATKLKAAPDALIPMFRRE